MLSFILSALLSFVFWLLPIVGTVVLGYLAFKLWVHYIQQDFLSGVTWVLLEITPPRDVLRSPRGMELFFANALYQWSMKGGREEYWQGAVWFPFSLEIASIDGNVHFYLRTPSRIKDLVETQMYAQYPQAQIKVVPDYTLGVDEISPKSAWKLYGCEFKLEKHEAYPIRTYVDYGLDKDPKEELKVDPISSIIELFGSLNKGEQMWMQIVIKPPKKVYGGGLFKKGHDWVKESENEIKKLLKPFTAEKDEGKRVEIRVPDFYKKHVEGLANKRTKLGFETGIRCCYIAKKEKFSMNNRRALRLMFRQYTNPSINGLTRFNGTQPDAYGGWFLASQETVTLLANRILNEYRERSFFYSKLRQIIFNKHNLFWPITLWLKPYLHSETFILNVEELASLWHFPGQILKVPSLERIESKEAAPPANLPI